jgi:hypothetical protein
VKVVVNRLAGDEVIVVQGDALCIRISRRTQIAIVTIVDDDCACPMRRPVVESTSLLWVTHANLVIERLSTFEKKVFDW